MEIVAVRHSLLQLDAAGDDESDAVAIALVELLLSATNCFYRQRCLATAALRSTSAQLSSNVIDTALAAALGHDNALDSARFAAETRPEAEVKDRHAAHCVPTKSPEKAARSTSPQAPRAADGKRPSRRRRKLHKGGTEPPAVALPEVQTVDAMFEQEFTEEDENPDIKEWREKCLKSLETKKPGFSKWIAIARAFNKTENRVSMETGVIAPPLENVVAEFAVSPVRMKSNVDSFSSIQDVVGGTENDVDTTRRRSSSRRQSTVQDSNGRGGRKMPSSIHSIAENPQRQSRRRSQSANIADSALQQQRKTTGAMLLSDSLSRQKTMRRPSTSEFLSGGSLNNEWSSRRNLWSYEHDTDSPASQTFVEESNEFSASALPTTMTVASGVVLLQGESVIEGPEWVENTSAMSRKRFDLQQRLATDALLNTPLERESHSPSSPNLGSPLHFGHRPISPLSEMHFRDYEEVPAEPIAIPPLSPISTSSLAIPRTHLTPSLSTPLIRVRTSAANAKAGCSMVFNLRDDASGSNRSLGSNTSSSSHTSLGSLKIRPSTALRAVAGPQSVVPGRVRASSATPTSTRTLSQSQSAATIASVKTASMKYQREFPKPRAGVIRVVNDKAASLLVGTDNRQRSAWMS